jgi:uncharacterized membrane protein YfhO
VLPRAFVEGSPEPATIVRYAANEVVVRATLDGPGRVVLTDAYAPGWRAYADSMELPILPAAAAFRAVYLPNGGTWTVRFTYEPASLRLGLALSATSLVVLLLVLLMGTRSWRRATPRRRETSQSIVVA